MNRVIGHEHVLELLARAVIKNRVAHCYLFTGTDGIGKKMTGVRLASLLNCPSPSKDPRCTCNVCRRIEAGNHPDFEVILPDRGSIRIEQIRLLQNYFKFPPYEGRWRIALIDDAHLLTRAAQNALLKTMEEPPPGRMMILVSSKPHLLLPTVRSRCRRIRFAPLRDKDVAFLLQREKKMSEEKALILASLSGGSVSEALRFDTKSFSEIRIQILNVLTSGNASRWCDLLALSAQISRDQDSVREALKIIASWLRDIVRLKWLHDTTILTNRDYIGVMKGMRDILDAYQILSCYDELLKALELAESDSNVNRNLVADVMLTRIALLLKRWTPVPT